MEVEFKLFGSFTLNEFIKILVGGLIALGIFLLPIPPLIKIPFMAISVLTGLAMAMVKNLGVWLRGFVKALFVSPRYVWVKGGQTPDILKSKPKVTGGTDQKVSSMTKTKRLDISELPLEQLFVSRDKESIASQGTSQDKSSGVKESNVDRVYQEIFGDDVTLATLGQMPQKVASQPVDESVADESQPAGNIEEEIKRLKYQLSMLAKDKNYEQKEQEIMGRINDLLHELKANQTDVPKTPLTNPDNTLQLRREETGGKIVLGIVVDKKDTPLENVNVNFINTATGETFSVVTSKQGRFATQKQLPSGEYTVTLDDGKNRFHTYKIIVGDQKLPAYKFRTR